MQKLESNMRSCIRMAGHSVDVRPGFRFLCHTLRKTAENPLKMASDQKLFNIKVVRLDEAVDFDIKHVKIRGRMWILEPKQ